MLFLALGPAFAPGLVFALALGFGTSRRVAADDRRGAGVPALTALLVAGAALVFVARRALAGVAGLSAASGACASPTELRSRPNSADRSAPPSTLSLAGPYETGQRVSRAEFNAIQLTRHAICPLCNYTIYPRGRPSSTE